MKTEVVSGPSSVVSRGDTDASVAFVALIELFTDLNGVSAEGNELRTTSGMGPRQLVNLGWVRKSDTGRYTDTYVPSGALAEALNLPSAIGHLPSTSPPVPTLPEDSAASHGAESSASSSDVSRPSPAPGGPADGDSALRAGLPSAICHLPSPAALQEAERMVEAVSIVVEECCGTLDAICLSQQAENWPDARAIERATFRLLKLARHLHSVVQNRQMVISVAAMRPTQPK